MSAVTFRNVNKSFGSKQALQNLSFKVPSGSICGLVGANGAGKTTTMGVISGLLKADSGEINLLGSGPFSVERHRGRIGLMPQDSSPSLHSSILASLKYFAELQGYTRSEAAVAAERALVAVGLGDRQRAKFLSLSHGMRRRMIIAQAILGQPDLILLDEPTSGLDPDVVVLIRNQILSLKGKSTVIVSSHILAELETICDHVIFLENGSCMRDDSLGAIMNQSIRVAYTLEKKPDLQLLQKQFPEAKLSYQKNQFLVEKTNHRTVESLNQEMLPLLLDQKLGIQEVRSGDSLEEAWLEARQERSSPKA
ncbi:MAG: ABC transporter ATP-binding protein [Polyangiaceae bacterium]|nr:ABC transporter ATP-binding protein [Polyangiaceae bacterium]